MSHIDKVFNTLISNSTNDQIIDLLHHLMGLEDSRELLQSERDMLSLLKYWYDDNIDIQYSNKRCNQPV